MLLSAGSVIAVIVVLSYRYYRRSRGVNPLKEKLLPREPLREVSGDEEV